VATLEPALRPTRGGSDDRRFATGGLFKGGGGGGSVAALDDIAISIDGSTCASLESSVVDDESLPVKLDMEALCFIK
jgi:hypothetical protein